MNYYQDNRNDFSRDYDNYSRNNDYSRDFDNKNSFDSKNDFDHNSKHSCCVRKVEETFCCFPSYYNEEKKEDKKQDKKEEKKECKHCWEGTFKICPKHDDYDDKKDDKKDYNNKDYYNNDRDYDKKDECYDEKDNKKDEHKCGCRSNNRCCGFCGFNRFCRW